jgi:hypothetical protein
MFIIQSDVYNLREHGLAERDVNLSYQQLPVNVSLNYQQLPVHNFSP